MKRYVSIFSCAFVEGEMKKDIFALFQHEERREKIICTRGCVWLWDTQTCKKKGRRWAIVSNFACRNDNKSIENKHVRGSHRERPIVKGNHHQVRAAVCLPRPSA
jgi:hypothetical protein